MKIHKLILSSLIVLPFVAQLQAQSSMIEEVVVTAAKRAQTLQEIPIAVSVTSSDTIEKAQIQDISDLQSLIPSLRVTTLQTSRNTNFVIRGFGNGANNPGIEPSVGVFVDGVYRSRSAAAISDLPRLERVEVLRGPQSTLFGKNASAGVISVVTPKPSGESGGFISASIGDYNATVVKGLYEGAISNDLSFDISGSYNKRDGYFDNLETGDELNERNRRGIRGQLVYTPTDSTEFRVIADYDEIDEACCGVINLVSGPATGAINFVGGQLVPNDDSALEGYYDGDAINEIENTGISIQADIDFDNFVLTSITAFRTSDAIDNQDIDFSSAQLSASNLNDIEIETFTQEFRLTSKGIEAFDWMVGGFFFDETVDYKSDVVFGETFRAYADLLAAGAGAPGAFAGVEQAFGFPIGTFYANNTGTFETFSLDDQAFSLFGQLDFYLNESLTATVGFNYTEDDKEATINQVNTEVFSGQLDLASFGLQALAPLLFIPNTVNLPNAVEDNETNDADLTYTVRLAYDFSDDLNLYASIATGFKASSWNLSRDSAPVLADFNALQVAGLAVPNMKVGTRFADPEEAKVFEIGIKARFERGSINVAIFDQEIKGFQSNIFLGTGFSLQNAGSQTTKGLEFDSSYYVTDALRLSFAGTFLDPKYDSFPNSSAGDLTGEKPAGINEVALSLSAQYEFVLADMEAYVRSDYQYEDEIQVVDGISADIASRQVKLLNLAAGIQTDNGISVTLWARNLTDEDYLITAFPSVAQSGSVSGYRNEPRTFGVTFRKDF